MPLVSRGVVAGALEGEEFVDRRDRYRVVAPQAHFPTLRSIDDIIRDRRAARLHDGDSRNDLRVDLKRFREIAGAEGRGNVAHVQADRRHATRVGSVGAIEDDASPIGQVLKHVRGCVLIDAHHRSTTFLHRGEVSILASREHQDGDQKSRQHGSLTGRMPERGQLLVEKVFHRLASV